MEEDTRPTVAMARAVQVRPPLATQRRYIVVRYVPIVNLNSDSYIPIASTSFTFPRLLRFSFHMFMYRMC